MTDIPLEAWSINGISALASSLGNPLIMDTMIANTCYNNIGRLDFARVLVEMDDGKEFKKKCNIEIMTIISKGQKMLTLHMIGNLLLTHIVKCLVMTTMDAKRGLRLQRKKKRIEEQENRNRMASNKAKMQAKRRNFSYMQNNNRDKGKGQQYSELIMIELKITSWNIRGMSNGNKQKEVMKFIKEENLQVYAIIETHIKANKIKEVCDKVTRQYVLCHIKELYLHKRVSGSHPWALLGDINVTLNIKEHSSGGSYVTKEMKDFKYCINSIELEDIGSLGFFFAWTTSLRNPEANVLKKLDRVMVSEGFLE
ncbi:RNA-directed DNA polymerase, eukaryota, reverse transcriptase zinc-binding domain protein [Tanacetum coccineum]